MAKTQNLDFSVIYDCFNFANGPLTHNKLTMNIHSLAHHPSDIHNQVIINKKVWLVRPDIHARSTSRIKSDRVNRVVIEETVTD